MKKLLALILALAMSLSLAACGGSSTAESDGTASAPAAETETADASAGAGTTSGDGETYTVGIANWVDDASLNQIVSNIESELEAKGTELGCTFTVNYDNAQGDSAALNQIAANMMADQVDVIVAIATPVATVMQGTTEGTDVPVVFSAVSNPVDSGLVESMDAPGGNLTGTSDALDTETIMKLMVAVNPDLKKIGLLYDTAQDSSAPAIEAAKAWCDENGIEYEEKTGTTTDDISLAADSLIADGVEAVFTPTDNSVMTAELSIYEKFAEAGIPHYCGADSFALNGAFCGYGVDYANLGVMTADMVVDLLVNGADPAETPVMTFDNGIATINTETCEALGLELDTVKTAIEPLCTQVQEIQTSEEFEE